MHGRSHEEVSHRQSTQFDHTPMSTHLILRSFACVHPLGDPNVGRLAQVDFSMRHQSAPGEMRFCAHVSAISELVMTTLQ